MVVRAWLRLRKIAGRSARRLECNPVGETSIRRCTKRWRRTDVGKGRRPRRVAMYQPDISSMQLLRPARVVVKQWNGWYHAPTVNASDKDFIPYSA
jgi:hypothetical protein